MAHHTFVSIRHRRADEDIYFFLKNPDGTLHFFVSTDVAINGSYGYKNIRKDFCKKFDIDTAHFGKYYVQELDIALSDIIENASISVAELRVDEVFFQKTIEQVDHFEWVTYNQLDIIKNRLLGAHNIVLMKIRIDDKLTDLDSNLMEGIRILQKAQSQQRLVIFAGAGISKDSGIPLWKDIKNEMLSVLGSPEIFENTDPTVIAQYLYKARGQTEYNQKIRELLGFYKNLQPNAIHKAIVNLRPKHIITTNFDNLLENALPPSSSYYIIRRDQDFPYAHSDRFLIKMHGDWQIMNFVFKEEDYLSYSRDWPLTEGFVRGVFASHIVLFVGFSFEDRNLKQILDWVKDILKNDLQPAYLFSTDNKNKHELSYFESKGLHLLSWPDDLSPNLEKIGQKATKGYSWRSQKTADFLNFLGSDNFIKYERLRLAQKQSILEQMFDALWAFNAFNALPTYSIERLFPFSPFRLSASKKQADAESDRGRLDVRNESIIQLMKSVEIKDGQINVKKNGPISKEIINIDEYCSKLWYVFDKLRSSGIECIHRDDDDENHHPINIENPFSEQLLFTKWFEFKYDKLLESIEKREYSFGQVDWIPKPLRNGLLDGYVLFQMNFFDLAYEVFQKVENEAMRTGEYALYFLSRRNRVKTSREIYWRRFSAVYSESFVEKVKDDEDNTDIHETLRSIKVGPPVHQLLQEIQEDIVLKKYTNQIEDKYLKILEVYKNMQNPHFTHIGPHYAEQIEWSFENLCRFYITNGLISDDSRLFKKAAELTFEGLVASHQTSDRYKNRYQYFRIHSLIYFLRWINPKLLNTILRKYNVKEILFAEGHKVIFVNYSINLLKSTFYIDNLFNNTHENQLFQKYIKSNSLYSIDEKYFFPNLLVILSRINLSDTSELAKDLGNCVMACQQYLPRYLADSAAFMQFYQSHLNYFSHHQIEVLLNLLQKTKGLNPHNLQILSIQIKKIHPDFRITNPIFFQNLLMTESGENVQERLSALVKLNDFLEKPFQNRLAEGIRENLKNTTGLQGLHLYFDALLSGCIPPESFIETVKSALKKSFNNINKIQFTPNGDIDPFENASEFRGGELPHNYAWIVTKISRLISLSIIDKKDIKWLLKQPDLPSCIKWIINPNNFDYTNFNHFWLFYIEDEDTILKKIGTQNNKELIEAIQSGLHKIFSKKIAKIYFKYFSSAM